MIQDNYHGISKIIDRYWDIEILLSYIAMKYKLTKRKMIDNKDLVPYESRKNLYFLLNERVDCLQKIKKFRSRDHLHLIK